MVIFKIEVPGFQFFCKVVHIESSPMFSFFTEIDLFQLIFQGLFKLQFTNIGPQLSRQQECFLFLVFKVTAKQFATSNKPLSGSTIDRRTLIVNFTKLTINFAGKQGKSFIV